jgi:NAD(P)-dependent dehydrogenase (short-subunit alcohol dehydrogenase family)
LKRFVSSLNCYLGTSSGIGLATTKLLLELGAIVVAGDLNPVPLEDPNLAFQKVNVTSWEDQLKLFQKATSLHGTIDHVFANAGVKNKVAYIEDETDKNGQPVKPDMSVIDINLKGALYTTVLGYHYLKKKGKGSIVITSSTSSYMRFPFADYGKH